MSVATLRSPSVRRVTDWVAVASELGPVLARRAGEADDTDRFVADNYVDLKASGLTSAGVPVELGGGGATGTEMSAVIRELARHCGSTALAFSMHTHQVVVAAWRRAHQQAPVDALLRRVAAERIILLSSGGSDWLHGSGTAQRVEGGWRINARKVFSSGSPAGDLLLTSAVHDDPEAGPSVLHFGIPVTAAGVTVHENWRALGMRGTGSGDIVLRDVFVPDAAVSGRRPQGKWHPLFHIISMLAIPLIYSAYVGVAEAARDRAVRLAGQRRVTGHLLHMVGQLENEIAAARLALADMLAAGADNAPGMPTTNRVFIGRALVVRAVLHAVDLAMDVAGGAGYLRDTGLERLFRDAQGARYHPLPDGLQCEMAGRLALGLDPDAHDANA